MRRDLPGE